MELLLDILRKRRSVRKYTDEAVPQDKLEMILQAGLLSPTGKNLKSPEFILVRDKEMLKKLSLSRTVGAGTLAGADAAVVVIGDTALQDVWCEDCSIALAYMHLMASSLGIGSVWIQSRLRPSSVEGKSTDEFIREVLAIPAQYAVEGILSLGIPAETPPAYELPMADGPRVHSGKF